MPGCAAVNCTRRSENSRMFKFPSDPIRKAKWVQNMRRDNWTPSAYSCLCEKHFEESQYEQNRQDKWKKLKPNAVPTLFNVPDQPPMIDPPPRKSVYKPFTMGLKDCCVPGCGVTLKSVPERSFHRLPRDVALCSYWLKTINREDLIGFERFNNESRFRVCSDHFSEKQYGNTLQCKGKRLIKFAIPDILRGCSSQSADKELPTLQVPLEDNFEECCTLIGSGESPVPETPIETLEKRINTSMVTPETRKIKNLSVRLSTERIGEDCEMVLEDDKSEEESVSLQNAKEKLCRVCGQSEHSLTPIFGDTLMTQNFSLPLLEVMEMHLPLKLQADDHFPSNICSKCLNTLSEWHDLYATCAAADKAFRNAFGERITQESRKMTLCPKLLEEEFRRSDARRVLDDHDYVQEAYSITEQQFHSLIDVPIVKELVPSIIPPNVHFDKEKCQVKSISKNNTHNQLGMAQCQQLSINPEETAVEGIKQNYIQIVFNGKEEGYFEGCIDCEKTFFCKYCCDAFKEKTQLREHYKECREKTTMCEICGRTMVQKNLVRHKNRKHGVLIICEKCGKCVNKFQWYNHIKSAHSDSKYCEMCYSVIRPSSYVLHIKNHASGKVKPNFSVSSILMDGKSVYICPVCHKHFDDKVSLIVHLNEPIKIKCSICRFTVTNEKRFLLHKCKHWDCQFCSKKFFNRLKWKEHERIHTGEKPHKCNECNISFRTWSQKTNHLRNHRAPAFDCNYCSKKFWLRCELMDHMRRIHEGVRFTCEICSKKFSRKLSMKKHLQIHLREVVHFSCEVCDKKFTREVYLKKHLQKHGTELLTMRTV